MIVDVDEDYDESGYESSYKCEDDLTIKLHEIHKCNSLFGLKDAQKPNPTTLCELKDDDLDKMGGITQVVEGYCDAEYRADRADKANKTDKRAIIKLKLERERIELEKLKACQ